MLPLPRTWPYQKPDNVLDGAKQKGMSHTRTSRLSASSSSGVHAPFLASSDMCFTLAAWQVRQNMLPEVVRCCCYATAKVVLVDSHYPCCLHQEGQHHLFPEARGHIMLEEILVNTL